MSASVKRHSRKFLNPISHWDTGILEWNVEQAAIGCDANISIWDCSRKITLDFNYYTRQGMEQRAKKLNLIIEELTKFREALADCASNSYISIGEDDDER